MLIKQCKKRRKGFINLKTVVMRHNENNVYLDRASLSEVVQCLSLKPHMLPTLASTLQFSPSLKWQHEYHLLQEASYIFFCPSFPRLVAFLSHYPENCLSASDIKF
jgi:hypothetical protein